MRRRQTSTQATSSQVKRSQSPGDVGRGTSPEVAHTFASPLDVAITDNLGFGGHNAALVFKRYTGEGKTRQPADDEVLKVKSWYDAGERL